MSNASTTDQPSTPIYCPFCRSELTAVGEIGHNSKRERAAVECEDHGEIEIEWSRMQVGGLDE